MSVTGAQGTRRRWVLACAAGEALGVTLSGTIGAMVPGAVVSTADAIDPNLLHMVMVGAGALEGAALGSMQWLALRRSGVRSTGPRWVGMTALGLAVGWLAGTLLTALEPDELPGLATMAAFALLSGALLGAVVGALQSLAAEASSAAGLRWTLRNAIGWALGMLASVLAAPLLGAGPWEWSHLIVGLGSGALIGAIVGATTARAVPALVAPAR